MKTTWIITCSGDRPMTHIARDLRALGLEDAQVLTEIHCITGRASDALVERLRDVPGVLAVEKDVPVDLGPGTDDETW